MKPEDIVQVVETALDNKNKLDVSAVFFAGVLCGLFLFYSGALAFLLGLIFGIVAGQANITKIYFNRFLLSFKCRIGEITCLDVKQHKND